jgi:asparagine synthase (glutamine-hydrolysing)
MLAFFAGPRAAEADLGDRVARTLGLFAGLAAPFHQDGLSLFSQLPAVDSLPPRRARRTAPPSWRSWRPVQAKSGRTVLFHGWLDNREAIAAELGMAADDPAAVYGAAVDRWEAEADNRLLGNYCSIVHDLRTRSARLARSALRAPPLHFFHTRDSIGAASVPRALETMGLERQLNPRKLADALYFNPTEDEDFLIGSWRVGLGSIVQLEPGGFRKTVFYDPLKVPHGTIRGDRAELVREADRLLQEAAAIAVTGARQPAVQLSAGLDSSNVAARVLRALPTGARLKSFTTVPSAACSQPPVPGYCLDERSGVEAFAALHPALEPHFVQNEGVEFDHRLETMFLAMGTGQSCVPMNFRFHGLFEQASAQGCDIVLSSDLGETTFSSWGDWGYSEYLRTLRWGQLYKALEADDRGNRPLYRRLISRAIVPMLPDPLWRILRGLQRRSAEPINVEFAALRRSALAEHDVVQRARAAGLSFERIHYGWRQQLRIDQLARGDIESSDYQQGLEQIYEVRLRDVPAYRPLYEFCTGLRTDMFMHDGQMRWLARELGRGLMPEEQRTGREIGIQYSDWHALMTPRVPQMRGQLAAARSDPDLAGLIDFDKLDALLDDWPVQSSIDDEVYFPRGFTLPRALTMVRYVQYMTGRNASNVSVET